MSFPEKLETAEDLEQAFEVGNEMLVRYVFFRVGRREIAEEITQETFVKAWKARESFDPSKSSLKNWLFTLALNTLRDYYRVETKKETYELTEEIALPDNIAQDLEQKDMVQFVLSQMKQLSENDAVLIHLRYIEQYSIAEIATTIKKGNSATKVALHRALQKLIARCKGEM
jgi:RNA polymerase sigma-70 factor (ECF subfamily)